MVLHFSHHHPLAPADKVAIFALCSICGALATRPAAAPIYRCGDSACWFHLHHHCSELPQKLHHPFHQHHPLSLLSLQNKEEFRCHACGKVPRGKFAFRCDLCEFGLDVCCASLMPEKVDGVGDGELSYRRVKFVGHEHELLVCYKDIDSFEVSCSACELPFQDSIYVCLECKILLHKPCAELPLTINHPFHPRHRLVLFTQVPPGERFTRCKGCLRDFEAGFTYRCVECNFLLGTGCASLVPRKFAFHEHPLALFEKTNFNCSKCRCRKCTSVLGCVLCGFNIHLHCFPDLPEVVVGGRYHRHALRLTKTPVQDYEVESDDAEFYCDKCEQERSLPDPTYSCQECHYVAHVQCMVSKEEILSHGEEVLVVGQLLGDESSSKVVRETMNKLRMEEEENQKNQANDFSSLADLDAEIVSLKAQVVELQAKIDALTNKRARFIFR
ncbi:uncharacterized protein LOC130794232 [Actinidia eriantha]|uniref:uncharacterized protein LOC130794232 n=1 Tax=Actinidia eriantha TaxID=165200 RepID=UPI00258C9DC7|nr:uncharacterized protein LOC130794232 [Actinidia eriantha]